MGVKCDVHSLNCFGIRSIENVQWLTQDLIEIELRTSLFTTFYKIQIVLENSDINDYNKVRI